jgi:hypothetical protein
LLCDFSPYNFYIRVSIQTANALLSFAQLYSWRDIEMGLHSIKIDILYQVTKVARSIYAPKKFVGGLISGYK